MASLVPQEVETTAGKDALPLPERVRDWEAEYLWERATPSYPARRREPEPDSDLRTPVPARP